MCRAWCGYSRQSSWVRCCSLLPAGQSIPFRSPTANSKVLAVYGTIILYVADASCWSNPRDHKNMRGLTEAMVWSTWGMAAFLWCV